MQEDPQFWRKCNNCKKPIGFESTYQVCSVSTCNSKRNGFAFCSVPCWAAHVPIYRHRDAWALEQKSPTKQQYLAEKSAESAPLSSVPMSSAPKSASTDAASVHKVQVSKEILVVASKTKDYIRLVSDMNTSAEVMELLSDKIRALCDQAILRARQEGRKTVMARDFFRSDSL